MRLDKRSMRIVRICGGRHDARAIREGDDGDATAIVGRVVGGSKAVVACPKRPSGTHTTVADAREAGNRRVVGIRQIYSRVMTDCEPGGISGNQDFGKDERVHQRQSSDREFCERAQDVGRTR